jgi:hypothetical protein
LEGEIDEGAALNFRRALTAAPKATRLILNSPGGVVPIALLIADDVSQRKLDTVIPAGSKCYSACAYIFLAGENRQADGELGVHQISSDAPDLQRAQVAISDIIDLLTRFDTPTEVLTVMFRTLPDDMYVFSAAEIEKFGINRVRLVDAADKSARAYVERENPRPASGLPDERTGSQRALYYFEGNEGQPGRAGEGTATWAQITRDNAPAAQATLRLNRQDVVTTVTVYKNSDPNLPAGHLVELQFQGSLGPSPIQRVPALVLKQTEQARGQPLTGAAVPVSPDLFWIALADDPAQSARNFQLLRVGLWFDIPILFKDGSRALLTFEKGIPGGRIFDRVLESWDVVSSTGPSPKTNLDGFAVTTRTIRVNEGASMKQLLFQNGATPEMAASIQAALVANFSFDFRAGQDFRLRLATSDDGRLRPISVSVYQGGRHLATVALAASGTYIAEKEPP